MSAGRTNLLGSGRNASNQRWQTTDGEITNMAKSVDEVRGQQSRHVATMNWLAEHPEVLDDYIDQWVAIDDERVIAHGESVVDVTREAADQGFDDPLLVPVMPYTFVGA